MSRTEPNPLRDQIGEKLWDWKEHPAQMVEELFGIVPDPWQFDALESFPHSPRLALKACVGPGKTAVLAWLSWNFLLTRPHPHIAATSISGANLRSNLWKEMALWRTKSDVLQNFFELNSKEIYERGNAATWKMEARTWPKDADADQIGHSLAGLHGKYPMWVLDETGAYPPAILPTCEGIFSGNPVEPHIVQAGNPLRRSGPLHHACTRGRVNWKVIEITGDPDDPKRSPRIPIEWARQQIAEWGRDSLQVKVRILGQFPDTDFNALIGPDEVAKAMARYYREHDIGAASRIMGVDVARFGDDASVIAKRQGIQMFPLIKRRDLDSLQGAGIVAREWEDWSADACFIDETGGFGGGWIDQLRALGRTPIGIPFSGEAHLPNRYYNKRAEMAFDLVAWIKAGGALPNDPQLAAELTETNYGFNKDRLILEPKEDIKTRLGYSPDEFDAAILTFAEPVLGRNQRRRPVNRMAQTSYDPFRELEQKVSTALADYDPFR